MADLLDEKDYEAVTEVDNTEKESRGFLLSILEPPICNHIDEVSNDNIGYISGIMADGVPFEAELYEAEVDGVQEISIGVMLPALMKRKEDKCVFTGNNITGYRYEEKAQNNGILYIGMVDEGEEDDLDIIKGYVSYLEENKVINFTTEYQNGSVNYFTDQRGNMFAYVMVIMIIDDGVVAYTDLDFRDFIKKKSHPNYFKVLE